MASLRGQKLFPNAQRKGYCYSCRCRVIANARLPATTHLRRSCHQLVVVCLSLQQMGGSVAIICPFYSADSSNSCMHCGRNGRIGALNTKCNSALDPIRHHHIDPRHVGELGN